MIFVVLGLVVIAFIVISVITFRLYFKSYSQYDFIWWIVSLFFGAVGAWVFVYICYLFANYIKKDLHLQEYKNQKSSIVRMLQEDYNSQNLSNAINFNNKQKMIVVENKTFLFKYSTSYYSVDTIQIPEKKFMPTSKVIVEGLESAPE